MKSPTVLQCDQCESNTGSLVASELDITYCAKIENAGGRLVCTYRETKPPPTQAPNDDENTKKPVVPDVTPKPADEKKPVVEKKPAMDKNPIYNEEPDDANKENEDNKDIKEEEEDHHKKTEEDKPVVNPPIADDTPLPEHPKAGQDKGDYTEEFEHPNDGLPPGSFRKHCTGCELLQQGRLLACDYCKRNNGVKRYTIALVGNCKFFACIDGTLRCDKVHSARL